MTRVPSIVQYLEQGLARWVYAVCDQRYALRRPATPGIVSLSSRQDEANMAQFEVTAAIPAPTKPDDVAARKLTLSVDGGESTVFDLDPTVATFTYPTPFAMGQVLTGTLVDFDAAGNASDPSSYSYTVTDTTPPSTPGEIAFESRQID